MHEFSIAINIVDIVIEAAEKAGAERVNDIELDIGDLSGIVTDALDFALESAAKGTLIENTKIIIHKLKGQARCMVCGAVFEHRNLFDPCPECLNYNPEILQGKELRVRSINID